MKNGNQDFLGTDTDGYEDIQLMRLIPLPDGMTVMCVDTDDEDNVVMRDCVDTPNCYCLAEAEEDGKRVVYPYELSNWSGFDLRATVIPIRHCPKCGKRLQPHMEECDNSTLYYTCKNCGYAATLKQSTVAWKNSSAGLFVSTDGGKTWSYGWESDDTAVRTAILLEQTLKELDDRYKKATELSEELLKELDERYKTATAISAELQKTLDQRYETAKKLSKELYEELDKRYGTLTEISEDLQKELDERYSVAKKLSEEVEKELDEKYQPSIPVSETAPEALAADTLWIDKKNLRLKLWDGEQWQTIGYEPEQPTEPTTPTEPEQPEPENPDTEEKDNGNKEETEDKKTDQEGARNDHKHLSGSGAVTDGESDPGDSPGQTI